MYGDSGNLKKKVEKPCKSVLSVLSVLKALRNHKFRDTKFIE
jgi:hypothetical protein